MNFPSISSMSEFGIDYGLIFGKFNSLSSEENFNEFWWKETCKFEAFLHESLKNSDIFVSDHVPDYKTFTIGIDEKIAFPKLLQAAMHFLQEKHSDASITITFLTRFPLASGRIIISLNGCWIEQDLFYWALACDLLKPLGLDSNHTKALALNAKVTDAAPWLEDTAAIKLHPRAFWDIVYGGSESPPMGKSERAIIKTHDLAYFIISRLNDKYGSLNPDETKNVYISGSLTEYRVIKVECSVKECTQSFVEKLYAIVNGTDPSWSVRFSIYEELTKENSYLGSFILKSGHKYILECESFHS